MADNSTAAGPSTEARQPPPTVEGSVPPTPSDAALDRYHGSMRRGRIGYYAVVAVVVAVLATWVGIAWSRGEISHATLRTFAPAPPSMSLQQPGSDQHEVWRTAERAAIGAPHWGGTVVTFGTHTVGGRDARTGKPTWSYTRTDRDVCTAAQVDGTTIAVYANKGNCDELGAFDTDTGQRRWTRTLDMDGMPINGQPSFQVTPFTLVVASHSVVYAIASDSGYNRWFYDRYGCRIDHVVLGSAGALISQTCSAEVDCNDVKFCGRGPQLLLRDGSNGRDDDKKPNADLIKWNQLGNDDVPVSADDVLSAVDPAGHTLHLLDANRGRQTGAIPLDPVLPELGNVTSSPAGDAEVVWVSGVTYAVRPDTSSADWHADTGSAPTVVSQRGDANPDLATARITVPTDTGIGTLDGTDGTLSQRFKVAAPAAGSLVYSLGTGFLVTGPAGVVAYQ